MKRRDVLKSAILLPAIPSLAKAALQKPAQEQTFKAFIDGLSLQPKPYLWGSDGAGGGFIVPPEFSQALLGMAEKWKDTLGEMLREAGDEIVEESKNKIPHKVGQNRR